MSALAERLEGSRGSKRSDDDDDDDNDGDDDEEDDDDDNSDDDEDDDDDDDDDSDDDDDDDASGAADVACSIAVFAASAERKGDKLVLLWVLVLLSVLGSCW